MKTKQLIGFYLYYCLGFTHIHWKWGPLLLFYLVDNIFKMIGTMKRLNCDVTIEIHECNILIRLVTLVDGLKTNSEYIFPLFILKY